MKNILKYMAIVSIIIIICFALWYIGLYLFEKQVNSKEVDYSLTDQTNQSNLDSNKNNKVMLADMLKNNGEFVITEDNTDNTDKIIAGANLKKGIFIVDSARDEFLKIINDATGANYTISPDGYLQKTTTVGNNADIIEKFNKLIDSNNTLVLNISNTYKGILNDNMLLDFMIERTMYVQTFNYNESIKIALINPDRMEEKSEDLTQKEIYEEILLGI